MFELEDYSSGYHDSFLNKYADSCGPSLDLYMTDSLQDMLDIDIRTEIATVVGGSNELASLVSDLPSSLDHTIEAISSINNNSASISNNISLYAATSACSSSAWMGSGLSWSSSNDFYADVGACVNPISVMPLISSSLMHKSPKVSLNANGLRSTSGSPSPVSPTVNETKSHLTFSPAQMKVSANAIRNEQILSHIPKQIVAISSTVTAATTAPATLATNSALQRKNSAAVESIKKDLGAELRKAGTSSLAATSNQPKSVGGILGANGMLHGVSASASTNTIKLAPGIGGLTFANSITYNKLKQQSAAKSPQGSPVTANGTIVLKRDRDSSLLHNMTTLSANGQHVTKILARNIVQSASSFTPKSIASANSPLMQSNNNNSLSSSFSASHSQVAAGGNGSFSAGLTAISASSLIHHGATSSAATSSASSNSISAIAAVKPLQQKIKTAPIESEYPKPAYSYSCLIAMSLKNSRSGSLPVSEIYSFMCEHFPYFKTAPSGWKNSVRHNLSLNKCFEKIEKPATNGNQRKGCLWAMNPERITKMDEEVLKWSRKDPMAIRNAMVYPEHLEALERGEMKHGSSGDSDVELDSQSEIEETSDLELEQELDDTIVDNMFVEEDIEEDDDDDMAMGGMLNNGIVVLNASDGGGDGDGGNCDSADMVMVQHPHRDFDIEVEDIYDTIDLEDDKDAVQMAIAQGDIIELSPADLNRTAHPSSTSSSCSSSSSSGYQSPKRARLNINYSIGPAGELEKHIQIHQQPKQPSHLQQSIKQIKVHASALQQHHQMQAAKPQHILVQTITNGGSTTTTTIQAANGTHHHYQQLTAVPNQNRRKMQLVSRIA